MKSIATIFTFAAVLVLQFSAVAQTNVQAVQTNAYQWWFTNLNNVVVQTNAPVVRVNKAIIPVPRTDPGGLKRQTFVL